MVPLYPLKIAVADGRTIQQARRVVCICVVSSTIKGGKTLQDQYDDYGHTIYQWLSNRAKDVLLLRFRVEDAIESELVIGAGTFLQISFVAFSRYHDAPTCLSCRPDWNQAHCLKMRYGKRTLTMTVFAFGTLTLTLPWCFNSMLFCGRTRQTTLIAPAWLDIVRVRGEELHDIFSPYSCDATMEAKQQEDDPA